jgi:hypothetical protein
MSNSSHKRGDTFDYSDQLAMTINDVPVTDFTGMVGASEIRTPEGVLVAALDFTWLDVTQGLYRVRSPNPTTAWPVGLLLHDVQLTTPGGDVISTATETFKLVGDVTHG